MGDGGAAGGSYSSVEYGQGPGVKKQPIAWLFFCFDIHAYSVGPL